MAGAFACAAAMTALSSCVEDNAKKIDEAAGAAELAELQKGWANPPQSARPQVWWHWMNGNITKDGITKDLEWMHRIGLGGAIAIIRPYASKGSITFTAASETLGTKQIIIKVR